MLKNKTLNNRFLKLYVFILTVFLSSQNTFAIVGPNPILEKANIKKEEINKSVKDAKVDINLKEDESKKEKKIEQKINIYIEGSTAFIKSEEYNFDIVHEIAVPQTTVGTTTFSILNKVGEEIFSLDKSFNISTSTNMSFTIPADSLDAGDYKILAKTRMENNVVSIFTKDIGVLNYQEKIVEKTVNVDKIPLYVYVIFAILIFTTILLASLLLYMKSKVKKKVTKSKKLLKK